MPPIAEKIRLDQEKSGSQPWKRFGPYLSERQWGTVREDYSPGGTAYPGTSASAFSAISW